MVCTNETSRGFQSIALFAPDHQSLNLTLANSEDEFYGSLQRIWNQVITLEDMGIINDENDKFAWAYRFAEAELHRHCLQQAVK